MVKTARRPQVLSSLWGTGSHSPAWALRLTSRGGLSLAPPASIPTPGPQPHPLPHVLLLTGSPGAPGGPGKPLGPAGPSFPRGPGGPSSPCRGTKKGGEAPDTGCCPLPRTPCLYHSICSGRSLPLPPAGDGGGGISPWPLLCLPGPEDLDLQVVRGDPEDPSPLGAPLLLSFPVEEEGLVWDDGGDRPSSSRPLPVGRCRMGKEGLEVPL